MEDVELLNIALNTYIEEANGLFASINTIIQEYDGLRAHMTVGTPAMEIKEFYHRNRIPENDFRKIIRDELVKLSNSVKKVHKYVSEVNDEETYLKSVGLRRMLGNIADCENTYFKSATKPKVKDDLNDLGGILDETKNMTKTSNKFANMYCGIFAPGIN